jgi:hypothetical protein
LPLRRTVWTGTAPYFPPAYFVARKGPWRGVYALSFRFLTSSSENGSFTSKDRKGGLLLAPYFVTLLPLRFCSFPKEGGRNPLPEGGQQHLRWGCFLYKDKVSLAFTSFKKRPQQRVTSRIRQKRSPTFFITPFCLWRNEKSKKKPFLLTD